MNCQKQIEFDLPPVEQTFVVEAVVESGLPPRVIVTNTQGYFYPLDSSSFLNMFVDDAVVELSDGDTTYKLIYSFVNSNGVILPGYTSFDPDVIGQFGKNYTLHVQVGDKEAYAKAQLASSVILPVKGTALMSVRDRDKKDVIELAKILISRGFRLVATNGTAKTLNDQNIKCERVNKVREGRPHIVDMIKNDEIDLIVNTTEGKRAIMESTSIRAEAVKRNTTYYTTIGAAIATCEAIEHINDSDVNRLKDLHKEQHNE